MTPPQPRILVLDDDPSLLRTISLTLRIQGYVVETRSDGMDGLEALDDATFDLIVLDLQMPRMDGRQFYGELRQRGLTLPVLILSAYGADKAREELGAEAAIGKPFDPNELVLIIASLLEGSRSSSNRLDLS